MVHWEHIRTTKGVGHLYRTAVPGGWLVMIFTNGSPGLTFYPDPAHGWDGTSTPFTASPHSTTESDDAAETASPGEG